MYIQNISSVLDSQFVKIKYDCSGGFERCSKEWSLKLKDAKKNATANNGKHICRQCQLRSNNPMKRKEVKEKVKKTTIEKYGVSSALNTPENIAIRNKKMFGTQEAIDVRNEKTKKTSLERYGAEHIMKTNEGVERLKEAMQEKYGVDFPLQAEECREKMKQTCQERYGVDNPCQLPEVRIAMAKATLEKYGVEYYNQLPEMKDYLRENCKEWLAESWFAGGPNKGKPRPEAWNEKQRETVAELIAKGEWPAGYKKSKKGRYRSKKCNNASDPIFRSSYELRTHIWLDENSNVEWYEYEPFVIPYVGTDGHKRYYFPDFVVKFVNKEQLLLLEIKNDYAMTTGINISKDQAAKLFAKEHILDYELWGDDKISELGIDLQVYLERYSEF